MAVPPTPPLGKLALRRQFRAARTAYAASFGPIERARLEAALAAMLGNNLGPGIVAGYSACGGEIAVAASVFPRVAGGALRFHRCDAARLAPGFAAIPEPAADDLVVEPDIILVPLVAVDRAGNRLGQGAGHYDRTLAALRARGTVIAVGVGWDMQLVDALPADPWDQPLDALATPSQWLTFASRPPMSRR